MSTTAHCGKVKFAGIDPIRRTTVRGCPGAVTAGRIERRGAAPAASTAGACIRRKTARKVTAAMASQRTRAVLVERSGRVRSRPCCARIYDQVRPRADVGSRPAERRACGDALVVLTAHPTDFGQLSTANSCQLP